MLYYAVKCGITFSKRSLKDVGYAWKKNPVRIACLIKYIFNNTVKKWYK